MDQSRIIDNSVRPPAGARSRSDCRAVTALICTRNGSRTLSRTLSFCERALSKLASAEILVVDNESTDETSLIAKHFSQKSRVPVRVLSASPPGKTRAFCVGVRQASCGLITVVDDDNYVSEDFFRIVTDFFDAYPGVGIVASANRLVEGSVVPPWFFAVAESMYACGKPVLVDAVMEDAEGRVTADRSMPAGAGMTFRRDVLIEALDGGFRFFNDTERSKRIAGEDTELCMLFWSLGWRFGFDPRLRLEHDIDPARLTAKRHRDIAFAQGAGGVAVAAFIQSHLVSNGFLSLRGRWQWQALRAAKSWARALAKGWAPPADGSPRGLALPGGAMHAWGVLCRLLQTRGQYDQYVREISSAPWAAKRIR